MSLIFMGSKNILITIPWILTFQILHSAFPVLELIFPRKEKIQTTDLDMRAFNIASALE